MSNVDTMADFGRLATMPLRLGVHEAFRPRPDVRRGDHVLYVGRLSREKGVLELLEAAARSADPWPLRIVGAGPLEETLRTRARRLGLERARQLPAARPRPRPARAPLRERALRGHARRARDVRPRRAGGRRLRHAGRRVLDRARRCTRSAASATASCPATPPTSTARSPARAPRAQDPREAALIAWRHRWDRVLPRRDRVAARPGGA